MSIDPATVRAWIRGGLISYHDWQRHDAEPARPSQSFRGRNRGVDSRWRGNDGGEQGSLRETLSRGGRGCWKQAHQGSLGHLLHGRRRGTMYGRSVAGDPSSPRAYGEKSCRGPMRLRRSGYTERQPRSLVTFRSCCAVMVRRLAISTDLSRLHSIILAARNLARRGLMPCCDTRCRNMGSAPLVPARHTGHLIVAGPVPTSPILAARRLARRGLMPCCATRCLNMGSAPLVSARHTGHLIVVGPIPTSPRPPS